MSTGAQFYPGSSTAYRYDGRYPGLMQEINCCVTHTTEGTSLPDYDGGVSAPNSTLLPDIPNKRIKVYCHFPADMSARALVDNPDTTVRTNRNNCHQVELVGSCDPARRVSWGKLRAGVDYIYWPDAPDWLLRAYAGYLAWLHTEHGVPLTLTPRPFLAYPGSYGNSAARMALDEWADFEGHCGHMHVPDGNNHGDPGNTRMDLVLQYTRQIVAGDTNPPTSEEDDMPTPMELWAYKGKGEPIDAYAYLVTTNKRVAALAEQVSALTTKVASLETTGLTPEQITAIANAVADVQARRLAN
ncbi:hypothetical protein OTB20_32235 [Streptomyces sp. H27-H1]|uniref:hypothetical protein n=1 Tax=Streptomyces sp. H27-H1 TaxID=2996461 RepID=UPI00226F5C6F|nr:hypothetical protein [Streptomyces sp. H27-H1]MCY0930778.1 hypothetical protein [Streptomyces sp. H27-H1]